METQNNNHPAFDVEAIKWNELEKIGINREALEESGDLAVLLEGRKTGIQSLHLTCLGIEVVMDATLQLVNNEGEPQLEIVGIRPEQMEK